MKCISVLGSTGSIGISTLDVVAEHPREFKITALAAGKNISLLKKQIERFKPHHAAVIDEKNACDLSGLLKHKTTSIHYGVEGYRKIATAEEADIVVSAMSGSAGLLPTLDAIHAGKDIALANKEVLVMAGKIVLGSAADRGVRVIPVDSEHSAIFQCLQGQRKEAVRRIILTASGGPFVDCTDEELENVTPEQALKHPTWNMGKKITIDSATMMNKGLEVIEACRLFDLPPSMIDIVIHPQSVVHSMVEYRDGSVIAQMGVPDMRGPISYALSFPRRLMRREALLDLVKVGNLTFSDPDPVRFPALKLAYAAAQAGGTMPSVLNAANEIAVEAFILGKIKFKDISIVVEKVMSRHSILEEPSIETIIETDRQSRETALHVIEEMKN